MDFTFEEQQVAFRDAVRKFLMVEAAPELLREIWETESGRSRELRAKLADQGLTALSVPEEFGGIGLGDLDWVLINQELGYYAIRCRIPPISPPGCSTACPATCR